MPLRLPRGSLIRLFVKSRAQRLRMPHSSMLHATEQTECSDKAESERNPKHYGSAQVKLAASELSPPPLYRATFG